MSGESGTSRTIPSLLPRQLKGQPIISSILEHHLQRHGTRHGTGRYVTKRTGELSQPTGNGNDLQHMQLHRERKHSSGASVLQTPDTKPSSKILQLSIAVLLRPLSGLLVAAVSCIAHPSYPSLRKTDCQMESGYSRHRKADASRF